MTTDTRGRAEMEALRRQEGTRLQGNEPPPDARAMGAEAAQYTEPTLDPQWLDVYKMFLDRDGNEYGVPVRVPRGQWDKGGPNALQGAPPQPASPTGRSPSNPP